MSNSVQTNPLRTRTDFEQAALALLHPLEGLLSPGCARLHLGDTGAVYPDAVAEMEAYSRVLWALVPLIAGGSVAAKPLWEKWRTGLQNGTDLAHPEYWGELFDSDQRMVEMAAISLGLMLTPEDFFLSFSAEVQGNIHRWLDQINAFNMPVNNWRFFRVLVNTAFRMLNLPYNQARLDEDFGLIEDHYEDHGWYFDYENQREYYTHWAYHYYGMVYSVIMAEREPERAELFRERTRQIAPRFAAWFNAEGEGLPYGRSLTYRFAQVSFFAAMAYAGITAPGMDWGVIKGFLMRNIRKWCTRPIFTRDGILTIGYVYPSLLMAEGYNAPGSPYWALKAFLPLALPADHPFWTCEEKPYTPPAFLREEHGRMLIVRDEENLHVQAFPAGNHAEGHAHDDAKYEKFAYSTAFGFSVPKSVKMLMRGAFDSMLAFSDDGLTWCSCYGYESFSIGEDRVSRVWHPFADVTVSTEIIPMGDWHVRVHRITTPRPLYAAEGGYAIQRERGSEKPQIIVEDRRCAVLSDWGVSGIVALSGYGKPEVLATEPNTNLMASRALLPTLHAQLPAGEHLLVCAVLGAVVKGEIKWANLPEEVNLYAKLGK